MTVSSTDKRTQYTGGGTTGPFTIGFPILESTHLKVTRTVIATGVDTELTKDAGSDGYTVNGGLTEVTLTEVLPATERLTIERDVPQTQGADYVANNPFPAEVNEEALDKLTMISQQIQDAVDRSVKISSTSTGTAPSISASLTADKILAVNAAGDSIVSTTLDTSDLTTLEGISADITTVAGISANVTTVAGVSANVTTVAGIAANVTTAATISADITTVAGISSNVTTVAGDSLDIQALAPITGDITTAAGIAANITTVAGISANVTTVAGISSDVTTAAGISGDITTVAADGTDIGLVAGSITNVNTVATNIADVNSFANRYRIASSDPAVSLDEGDLVYNTTDNQLKFYDGTSWNAITTGIASLVEDTTPQLGGNLDLNGNVITGLVIGTDVQAYSAVLGSTVTSAGTATDGQVLTSDGAGGVAFEDVATVSDASTTVKGIVEKATAAEVTAETADKYPDAADLKSHNGIAKAWVNFNGSGTVAIRDSYNVSSITDNGTGNYTVNFSNSFANANRAVVVTVGRNGAGGGAAILANADDTTASAAGSAQVIAFTLAGSLVDGPNVFVSAYGDLA